MIALPPLIARPRRALAVVALALTTACASYPERVDSALDDFRRGHLEAALQSFRDTSVTGSAFLSGAEAGTVALVAGDWETAIEELGAAATEVRELEDRALVSPEGLGETLATWALNDRARPYEGEGFERVLLHCSLGLAYLALGHVEDLGVEVRRANRLLESEEELYATEYGAGGLGHFLSALAYELRGDLDEAYIDYRRMAEKGVGLGIAGPALLRLAGELGRDDERARWEADYGPDPERPDGAAAIVVLGAVGLGPFKDEGRVALPTRDGLWTMSVPRYVPRSQPVEGLRLVAEDSGPALRTVVVEDVTRTATENLEDRLAWIAARSAVRGLAKRELTHQLEKDHGLAGRLIGDVFAIVTERADLRSWLTLPDTWQAARLFVPPGEHSLRLEAVPGDSVWLGRFALEPGETMFVLARTVESRLYAHAIGGGLVEGP